MTLRISNANDGNIARLNKWADGIESDIQHLKSQVKTQQTTTSALTEQPANAALAANITSASVTMGSATIDGIVYCKITTSYNAPSPLGTFAGVFLVVTGYQGNATPVKVNEDTFTGASGGSHSFVTILNRTNESVTFYLVSKNINEEAETNWTSAPSAASTLNANNVVGSFTITNGNLTSGVLLGGDSGVAANGASGTLGLGLSPTGTNTVQSVAGVQSGTGTGAGGGVGFQAFDRSTPNSNHYWFYGTGGTHRLYYNGVGDVEYNTGSLKGFYRTPTTRTVEVQGGMSLEGVSDPVYRYRDVSGSGTQWANYANTTARLWNSSVGDVEYNTGTLKGFYRVPTTFPVEAQGQIGSVGSNAALYMNDRSVPSNSWAHYATGGIQRLYTGSADVEYNTGTAKGFFRSPTAFPLEAQGQIWSVGSNAALYTTDRTITNNEWVYYAAGGIQRNNSQTAGDLTFLTGSTYGLFRTGGTYTSETNGDVYATSAGTVKLRVQNTAASGRHWSIASI